MPPSYSSDHPVTETIATALRFVNSTASHIFLTGKAGTGKTTFLRELAGRTHKKFVVVAPTGVAALNAGGVTIHSQFLLPFGMFLPDRSRQVDMERGGAFYTSQALGRKHTLNSERKQVLRSIDMLVIDEVSMLRADLLDAMDYRLKAARGNFRQSFGGVQLLLIGDLYQLPPVVKREDEQAFGEYYGSPWFFESRALKQDGFVYVELDKIFRQQDDVFISLLNNLRNNKSTEEDIELLNRYYRPAGKGVPEEITLTTHNYKADDLNAKALSELKTPLHVLEATVEGDFPENMYPVLRNLELKEGARIMFTKNDSGGKAYYNGRQATVTSIEGDIKVTMADTREPYVLKKEVWQNKRYMMNATSQDVDEEVVGVFEQYPVKLAWAITVHKSQGLTFEKAIIDVGQAFADGQVYVALSRLRSLDGLILRTRINPSVIGTDRQVVTFAEASNRPEELPALLSQRQRDYLARLMSKTFDFEELVNEIQYITKKRDEEPAEPASVGTVLEGLRAALVAEEDNTGRFRNQLLTLLDAGHRDQLLERLGKGSAYYLKVLAIAQKSLLKHIADTRLRKRVKTYLNSLTGLDLLFFRKRGDMDKAAELTRTILDGRDDYDFERLTALRKEERVEWLKEIGQQIAPPPATRERKKRARRKSADGPSTYDITLNLLESGLSIEAIAKERGLVTGTIESHLAKAVGAGRISIFKFMSTEDVDKVTAAISEMPAGFGSVDLFQKLGGKFSFGIIRAVMQHLETEEQKE